MKITAQIISEKERIGHPGYLKNVNEELKHKLFEKLFDSIEEDKYYTICMRSFEYDDFYDCAVVKRLHLEIEESQRGKIILEPSIIEPLNFIETKSTVKRFKKAIKYIFKKL